MSDSETLIDAIDAVPVVDMCCCGSARHEHRYWVDHIYDYNGYACPGPTGGEYRHDAIATKQRHRKARAAVLDKAKAI